MSTAKKNEVAKAQTTSLQVAPPVDAAPQEILNSDIIIPKLLLMQGLSEFVADAKKSPDGRKISSGDLVNSITTEIVGDSETPLDVVPLKMTTEWRLEEKLGNKFEFRGSEPRTAANEDLPWEFKQGGADWKRTKVINLFALLTKDIAGYRQELQKAAETGEMPDLNKTLMPVVISFRSTSFNAGKKVATFYAQLRDMLRISPNVRPYNYTLELACKQQENDKGKYYVFEVGKTKKLDASMVEDAARWYGILNSMKEIRVDTAGESEDSSAPLSDQF